MKIPYLTSFRNWILPIAVCSWLLPTRVHAQQGLQGYPARKAVDGISLELKGVGLKKVLLMKAFMAAFYFDERVALTDPLSDVAKSIDVHYFVAIPGKKLSRFTVETMAENVSAAQIQAMQAQIERMGEYFVDLRPGDRYSLTYVPGEGTRFIYNGTLKGIIQGEDFAKALFATWLGEKPFDDSMKRQIMNLDAAGRDEKIVLSVPLPQGSI